MRRWNQSIAKLPIYFTMILALPKNGQYFCSKSIYDFPSRLKMLLQVTLLTFKDTISNWRFPIHPESDQQVLLHRYTLKEM